MIPTKHCSCPCHHTPGMKHFVACCDSPPDTCPRFCPDCDRIVNTMILIFGEEVCSDCGYFFDYVEDYHDN